MFLKKHLISFSFTSFLISFAVPGILNVHGAKQKKRICTFSDPVLRVTKLFDWQSTRRMKSKTAYKFRLHRSSSKVGREVVYTVTRQR